VVGAFFLTAKTQMNYEEKEQNIFATLCAFAVKKIKAQRNFVE